MATGAPKVIKNDVEKPSIWQSSKNQLFGCHIDHYLDASEPLKSQRILYNEGILKNVRLEEEKELGTCTGQQGAHQGEQKEGQEEEGQGR